MKYCYHCSHFSPNDANFCVTCGSSFGYRFCQRLHRNPANASHCATCGSRELSQPHRKRPASLGLMLVLAALVLFIVLFAIVISYEALSATRHLQG